MFHTNWYDWLLSHWSQLSIPQSLIVYCVNLLTERTIIHQAYFQMLRRGFFMDAIFTTTISYYAILNVQRHIKINVGIDVRRKYADRKEISSVALG